jgi:hypothetical protein
MRVAMEAKDATDATETIGAIGGKYEAPYFAIGWYKLLNNVKSLIEPLASRVHELSVFTYQLLKPKLERSIVDRAINRERADPLKRF